MNNRKCMNYMLCLLVIILVLSGCTKGDKYLEAYPYLPSYENMEQLSFVEPKEGKMSATVYQIKNKSAESFLEEYEAILKEEGWQVTEDDKPKSFVVEKDEHKALIGAEDGSDGVIINIVAK